MDELLPCPFCDSDMELKIYITPGGRYYAGCTHCQTYCTDSYATAHDAIRRWNSRPREDALTAQLAAAEERERVLREALKFYASGVNWTVAYTEEYGLVDAMTDGPATAQKALLPQPPTEAK